jgi:hypothetical protein
MTSTTAAERCERKKTRKNKSQQQGKRARVTAWLYHLIPIRDFLDGFGY